jgi:maltose O-acetyltransferase
MRSLWSRILLKLGWLERVTWLRAQGLTIGSRCAILEEVWIDPAHLSLITIGQSVTLAPRVQIVAHDASTKQALGYTRLGRVAIGDRVFVGAGSLILPGVTIGDDVIIGAGSVVTKDVPSGSVAAGNPATVTDSMTAFLTRRGTELVSQGHRYVR